MATIKFFCDPAKPTSSGGFAVILSLRGDPPPLPAELFEARNMAETLAAFDAYKARAASLGVPCVVGMRLHDGRAPNGFKAFTAKRFFHPLNVPGVQAA